MMLPTLSSLDPQMLRARLAAPVDDPERGLVIRTGPFVTRIRSRLPEVAEALSVLYGDYPLATPDGFVDFNVGVRRPWWRRGQRAQVRFDFEGQEPFNPLPGAQAVPLLEWGLNWCVSALCHDTLNLHAAVLERNGQALILPAPSGSGKSTLCAALAFSGWRLLSDELTLIDPRDGQVRPLPRPISLKNASIAAIRSFAPQAVVGSNVADTIKGTVAHLRPPASAVQRAAERACPAWIVLPRYVANGGLRWQAMEKTDGLMHLVENAFNYDVFGASGFDLLARVVSGCRCLRFEYGGDLHAAVQAFDDLLADRVEAQAGMQS
ncbi:MAG: HprK-related kinase A [Rubrivivax sp.]|nr:HprK-related kinase A [Rubrivivax sp.]